MYKEFPNLTDAPLQLLMSYPSQHSLSACFLLYFQELEITYIKQMITTTVPDDALWLSCDHTFRSVSNIGLYRSQDNKWIPQYKGLFVY